MSNTFKQPGEVMDYLNSSGSAIATGTPIVVGTRVGVALATIANGAIGPVAMSGVHTLAKLSTDVVAQGALLYWDNTNKRLTTTASGNTLAGYAFTGAASGVTSADVKLNA